MGRDTARYVVVEVVLCEMCCQWWDAECGGVPMCDVECYVKQW